MSFDPDEYIKLRVNPQPPAAFDPDAYMKLKGIPIPVSGETKALAALQGFGKEATFGYLPELQAGLARLLPNPTAEADEKLKALGIKVPEEDLTAQFRERQKTLEKQAPDSFLAGQIGGMGSQALMTSAGLGALGKGVGLIAPKALGALPQAGTIPASMLEAGAQSAAYNPEESGQSRLKSGLIGAGSAGAIGLVGKGIAKAGEAISKGAENLTRRALGFQMSDLKKLGADKFVTHHDVSKMAIDSGILRAGDAEAKFAAASELRNQIGSQLGQLKEQLGKEIPPVDLLDVAQKIESGVAAAVKGTANATQVKDGIQKTMENLLTEVPENASVIDLMKFKSSIDDILYKDAIAKLPENPPAVQKGLSLFRDKLSTQIKDMVNSLGGEKAKQLADLNKQYGTASVLKAITEKETYRELGNNMIPLRSAILGAGALGGGIFGGGSDVTGRSTSALGGGLLAAGLMHPASLTAFAKSAPTISKGLTKGGTAIQKLAPRVGGLIGSK